MFWSREPNDNLIPGPKGYPIIGNFFDFQSRNLRDVFAKWQKQYGEIFSVRLLNRRIIVLSGYDLLKEAFVKKADVFSERAAINILKVTSPAEGFWSKRSHQWKVNRKVCVRAYRNCGMGTTIMQTKIQNEVRFFLDAVEQFNGEPFNISLLLHKAVANVICTLLFGRRMDYGDPVLQDIVRIVHENMMTPIMFTYPILKYIPGDPFHLRRFIINEKRLLQYCTERVDQHLENFSGDSVDNFIDLYIKQMRNSPNDETINRTELIGLVVGQMFAGTEATAHTIMWGLVYLLNDPCIQNKLRNELHEAISTPRLPDASDKANLPYLEATMEEILRLSCVAPFSVPHVAICDSTLRGYKIPRGATLVPFLHSVLMDEGLWEEPYSFKPTRFLNEDGTVKRTEEVIPFSMGPRMCPGEIIARTDMFLFVSAMLQRFQFLPPEGESPPSMKENVGSITEPLDFLVRAIPDRQ